MKREAAELLADGFRQAGVPVDTDTLHAEMTEMLDTGSVAREVQKWHEQAGHSFAGSNRCDDCKTAKRHWWVAR